MITAAFGVQYVILNNRMVVVGDRGGMVEMVDGTTGGVSFRAGDTDDLARVLCGVLREPAWSRVERGLVARRRILELCDPERVARERAGWYRSVQDRATEGACERVGERRGWWRAVEGAFEARRAAQV